MFTQSADLDRDRIVAGKNRQPLPSFPNTSVPRVTSALIFGPPPEGESSRCYLLTQVNSLTDIKKEQGGIKSLIRALESWLGSYYCYPNNHQYSSNNKLTACRREIASASVNSNENSARLPEHTAATLKLTKDGNCSKDNDKSQDKLRQ